LISVDWREILDQALADARDGGEAGVQCFHDAAVAPTLARFRNIRLQQVLSASRVHRLCLFPWHGCEGPIVQAPAPARLVEGGMATTALIAHIATAKYAWQPTSACGAPLWMKMVAARADLSESLRRAIVQG
jgi:hypothetical protein